MQHAVEMPFVDANNRSATVEGVRFKNFDKVTRGDVLFNLSTPKASMEMVAEADGYFVLLTEDGREEEAGKRVALICTTLGEAQMALESVKSASSSGRDVKATKKARAAAESIGLDLGLIRKDGIITEADVQAYVDAQRGTAP